MAASICSTRPMPGVYHSVPRGGREGDVRLAVLFECVHKYKGVAAVPRIAVEDNSRMSLRIRAEEKALLLRAVALNHTDLTDFVTQAALREADAVIEASEVVTLSARDSLRVLNLLENPPAPTDKLRAAIAAMPKQ